jgi:hypothetical protein
VRRNWQALFSGEPLALRSEDVLAAVEKHAGSIAKPTANALGLPVGALRRLIEQMGLDARVNAIRKRYKRRPATFRPDQVFDHPYRIYEQRLPAGYR